VQQFLLVFHVFLSIGIIGLVLIQRGKGADAGAALGGGSSGSVFGSQGSANFLSTATAVLATGFFIVSLTLAYLASNREQVTSVVNNGSVMSTPAETTSPATDVPVATDTKAKTEDVPAAVETPSNSSDVPAAE